MSNADAARLTYLSPNTVKSYIRTIFDHHRIEHWRGGP
jgi:DNA-binding CsgD family transcriptional regulator